MALALSLILKLGGYLKYGMSPLYQSCKINLAVVTKSASAPLNNLPFFKAT